MMPALGYAVPNTPAAPQPGQGGDELGSDPSDPSAAKQPERK
jgi:hypothetical protein